MYLVLTKAASEKFERVVDILDEYLLSSGEMLLKRLFIIYFILIFISI